LRGTAARHSTDV
jgi:quercetin 2,3-dioxygenase